MIIADVQGAAIPTAAKHGALILSALIGLPLIAADAINL